MRACFLLPTDVRFYVACSAFCPITALIAGSRLIDGTTAHADRLLHRAFVFLSEHINRTKTREMTSLQFFLYTPPPNEIRVIQRPLLRRRSPFMPTYEESNQIIGAKHNNIFLRMGYNIWPLSAGPFTGATRKIPTSRGN